MPRSPAPGPVARTRPHRRRKSARRARRRALVVLGATAFLVVVLVAAFGSSPSATHTGALVSSHLFPAGPPRPQIIAVEGPLQLQLPVTQSAVTAIGFHAAGTDALPLDPVGRRANEDLFSRIFHRIFGGGGGAAWYQLDGGDGPSTGAVDVGAVAGTDVYAPVSGTVVGIHPYVIDGAKLGNVLELQPQGSPGAVVVVSHLQVDPSLSVGAPVAAGASKLGTVIDYSGVERQALAAHTHDLGNHVTVEVDPAPGASLGY